MHMHRRRWPWVLVALVILAFPLARILITRQLESTILTRPKDHPTLPLPVDIGIVVRDITVPSGADTLHMRWVTPAAGEPVAAVFIAHGGQPERLEDWISVQQRLAHADIESATFDYAGFGASSGTASIDGMVRDTTSAFVAFVGTVAPARRIVALGLSGGCSQLLSLPPEQRSRADGLVLISCFSSVRDYLDDSRRLPAPFNLLVADVFDNVELAQGLTIPVLHLHGDADRIVPLARARVLHSALPPGRPLLEIAGMAHNDPFQHPNDAVWTPIENFVLQR